MFVDPDVVPQFLRHNYHINTVNVNNQSKTKRLMNLIIL